MDDFSVGVCVLVEKKKKKEICIYELFLKLG